MDDIFIDTVLSDKVCLSPSMIREGLKDCILEKLTKKFEEVCTYHGLIRKDSIEIHKYSLGQVRTFSLNGDVIYNVMYKAQVCNPAIGSIIRAKITNMNKFGILAEALEVLEIIVPRDEDMAIHNIGDEITISIIGKKFELGDTKISIVGKILSNSMPYDDDHKTIDYNDDSTEIQNNTDGEGNISPSDEDSDESEISDDELSTESSSLVTDSDSSSVSSVGENANDVTEVDEGIENDHDQENEDEPDT